MAERKSVTTKRSRKTQRKTAPRPARKAKKTLPDTIRFHYLKSNFFRVIHVDGAHGGITPRGQIQMALFSDRHPIPQQTVQRVTEEGTLGDEIRQERVEREGIVREVEVEAIMTLDTGRTLVKWLEDKVHTLEKLRPKVESSAKATTKKRHKR